MLADPEMTIKKVAGVNRATIYRSLDLGSYAKGALGTPLFRMGAMVLSRPKVPRLCVVIGDTAD